jgi:hypothetical protein
MCFLSIFMSFYILIIGVSDIHMGVELQIDCNVHDISVCDTLLYMTVISVCDTLLYIHSESIHTLQETHTFFALDNNVNNMQYSLISLFTNVLSVRASLMLYLTYANMGTTLRCFVLVPDCSLWWSAFSNSSSRYTRSPIRGWRCSCEERSDRRAAISCNHYKLVPYTHWEGNSYISVGTKTRLRVAIPTVIRDFSLLHNVQNSSGSTPIQWVPGRFYPR